MNYKFRELISNNDELFWIRLAAFLAFVIPIGMAPLIWFSNRDFPMISMFTGFWKLNFYLDLVIILGFVVCFLFFVFKPQWIAGIIVTVIYLFWIVLDQNRIQPFYFEIVFVVLALTQFKSGRQVAKQCLLLILIGTYFWSGVHKYNDVFFEKWLLGLENRIPYVPSWIKKCFTYAIPFLEAFFGVSLIFKNTRRIGVWLIAIMHLMILTTLTLSGTGFLIFPLTIFNVFTLFFLFYKQEDALFNKDFRKPKILFFSILVFVLPVFNFVGFYDHLPSFSYFSGKPKYAMVYFDEDTNLNNLPTSITKHILVHEGRNYIDFNYWSGNTIKVMVYPENRVYKKIQNYIDSYFDEPKTQLVYY
ncbi:MauE/DoxX family redox-associated membrane protein [Seonamhaeicola aphaedonensis]|uniref:Methylamine utilisation protein MauE domain-containing protein n=1 Tax=Seonamhaeicola aphaedonensis TaxID=1461338 RepID=A0A3D9HGP4_9FLAO|nr:MauE/DoxX family redox-associated membrane protein [Seonamhaeicola aphaedonensis]RED48431.1 hypothetical protein DFQ02_104277 [Seonamhaeicola aphaedonensis]